jgi:hypothetical protein
MGDSECVVRRDAGRGTREGKEGELHVAYHFSSTAELRQPLTLSLSPAGLPSVGNDTYLKIPSTHSG